MMAEICETWDCTGFKGHDGPCYDYHCCEILPREPEKLTRAERRRRERARH